MHWIYLTLAIVCEVIGTTALKATDGFARPGPVVFVVAGYLAAFVFLGLSLKSLPVGIAYAIWAAVGMVLIAMTGWIAYGERLDVWAAAGIALIIAGVVLIGGFSGTLDAAIEERHPVRDEPADAEPGQSRGRHGNFLHGQRNAPKG